MPKPDKLEDIFIASGKKTNPDAQDDKSESKTERLKTFFLRNHRRNLRNILLILVCIILLVCAICGVYLKKMFNLINYDDGTQNNPDITFATEEPEENLSFHTMYDIATADSIKDLLKTWATNGGEKLYSKYVINVLLIGEDNDEGSHRSDSCMLASVNTKTKKITLCSFLRDSYTYLEIEGEDRFDKTNHSYSWGGAAKLMQILSDNYKIKIDRFVSIDFESFIKVIDILGGVTVPVTESEAAYMNRTTKMAGFESGEAVHLDGKHALVYSRIRKLDSEIERTRRQREVISSLVKNIKASTLSDLNKAIETFLPYVSTNYKASEILSLATQAVGDGWLKYNIEGIAEPSEELRCGVKSYRTYTGYLDVWIVDYIKAAREVQLMLYGKTNVAIDPETHISAIDLAKGKTGSSADNDDDGYYYEYYYDSVDSETTRRSLFGWAKRSVETTRRRYLVKRTREYYNYTDAVKYEYEEPEEPEQPAQTEQSVQPAQPDDPGFGGGVTFTYGDMSQYYANDSGE
ncbi:MAG: LCP family protein [Clostridiales bacterium]|nr:LCP family protein [Clostridiales bacterium]